MDSAVQVALITGSAVVLAAAIAAIPVCLSLRHTRRALTARVAVVTAKVEAVAKDARESNIGINHQEHGMPTLIQRVIDQDTVNQNTAAELVAFRKWQGSALLILANQLGVVLPPQPPPVVTAPLQTRPAVVTAPAVVVDEAGP